MRKLLVATFVALLMAGCGEDTKKPGGDSPESNQSSAETPETETAEVGRIGLDNPQTQKKIIAGAIDHEKFEKRGEEGEELYYAPNQQTPYSGWVIQYKNGKRDGPSTGWCSNGQKWLEANCKDGKLMTMVAWKPNGEKCPVTNVVNGNGVWVWYHESDGTKALRVTYKDGVKVDD